ncbi:hypothetical protein FTW19_22905 [Terriglobus albidus]|uniref:Uncharacterized protein n=1 Tax=Terriglobus albidus TaxID=1592106 RepID=A0A5B9EKI2_9BACT|nr:hypothetical protein [Terriglobus albidus]QEE30586.1 hypothetical protein FTW19_22905 [Terriglobus albidus]
MAKVLNQHYRTWYAMLLRLYPRRFRERFSEEMAQTFDDMCLERQNANRGLFGFVLWIFFETSVGAIRENTTHMTQLSKTMLRVALVALCLLMVPLVASRVVEGWNWPPRAFVLVYVLFFGTGMAYALIARRMGSWAYKAGVGLALAAGFVLGWSNMVHVADSENPANLAYFSVLVVGIVGASLARLQPRGLARTLFAMAVTLAVIAALLPSGAPPYMARNMVIGHVILVVLFTTSGLLFRRASLAD